MKNKPASLLAVPLGKALSGILTARFTNRVDRLKPRASSQTTKTFFLEIATIKTFAYAEIIVIIDHYRASLIK